jgi:hypothetical protein
MDSRKRKLIKQLEELDEVTFVKKKMKFQYLTLTKK